jgi:hypothetical protein
MGIPESQLETWSHQGATTSASAFCKRIRTALQNDATLAIRNFEMFLQGSYRSSTNIHGDSDVDVVVTLNETYMPEYGRLDAYTRNGAKGRTQSASYHFTDFRRDVSNAIRHAFPLSTTADTGILSGNYFTGRGRETHGEITLRRVSRDRLDFESALEKHK